RPRCVDAIIPLLSTGPLAACAAVRKDLRVWCNHQCRRIEHDHAAGAAASTTTAVRIGTAATLARSKDGTGISHRDRRPDQIDRAPPMARRSPVRAVRALAAALQRGWDQRRTSERGHHATAIATLRTKAPSKTSTVVDRHGTGVTR